MPLEVFRTIDAIPDAVPDCLFLDEDNERFRVPRLTAHSASTTSPVEVGYILFQTPCNLYLFKKRLEHHALAGDRPNDFLNRAWMNHAGRAVVRAALDPDRTAPINMTDVYDNELRSFGGRFPSAIEREYFGNFVDTFGVLERPDPAE
ncbi:hypothetical protein KA047_02085 [Candidatus Saccharibacteria bacterium]|nr:hypothetical protein [Candidatus Saccharibacteria bacterium]